MADYAPNFTARLRVRYHGGGANHTQTWRFTRGADLTGDITAALIAIQGFYDALADSLFDDCAVLGVTYADVASDIFLPIAAGTLTLVGTSAIAGQPPAVKAQSVSFVGRTAGGLRAIIYQYGMDQSPGASLASEDFRINPGELPTVSAAIDVLNSVSAAHLIGNDGQAITWYPYANSKYNDYWEKKVRQGA